MRERTLICGPSGPLIERDRCRQPISTRLSSRRVFAESRLVEQEPGGPSSPAMTEGSPPNSFRPRQRSKAPPTCPRRAPKVREHAVGERTSAPRSDSRSRTSVHASWARLRK